MAYLYMQVNPQSPSSSGSEAAFGKPMSFYCSSAFSPAIEAQAGLVAKEARIVQATVQDQHWNCPAGQSG